MPDNLDDIDDATDDDYCTTCGGSGGGFPPFTCWACHGTGRSASRTQEQREDEVRRDMKIDDQLTKEG
jgi:DnaJ-class molecular chaperone